MVHVTATPDPTRSTDLGRRRLSSLRRAGDTVRHFGGTVEIGRCAMRRGRRS